MILLNKVHVLSFILTPVTSLFFANNNWQQRDKCRLNFTKKSFKIFHKNIPAFFTLLPKINKKFERNKSRKNSSIFRKCSSNKAILQKITISSTNNRMKKSDQSVKWINSEEQNLILLLHLYKFHQEIQPIRF